MLKKFFEDFKQFTWFQKSFFAIVALLLLGYGLLHAGLVKLPAAIAQDCSQVSNSKTLEIKMFDDYFEPREVDAEVCDQLRFTNFGSREMWPAVGPHPTHTAYPGFDARRNIKPGQSFEFILNRTGTYSFHDHNKDDMIGRVTITK